MELADVKQALNIDFPDQDEYLTILMKSALKRAESIMGETLEDVNLEFENPEVYNAILEDVATMFQNRGEKSTGSDSSIIVYRRNSKRPML